MTLLQRVSSFVSLAKTELLRFSLEIKINLVQQKKVGGIRVLKRICTCLPRPRSLERNRLVALNRRWKVEGEISSQGRVGNGGAFANADACRMGMREKGVRLAVPTRFKF